MYKIRNKDTGRFSMGGSRPRWTDDGKIFTKYNHVTSHLNHVENGEYHNCEVVEVQIVETGNNVEVSDWREKPSTTKAKARDAKMRVLRDIEYRERQKELLQKELDRLNGIS